MKQHFKNWGAVWILTFLFLASWLLQLVNQVDEVTQAAKEHNQQFLWGDFWPQFFSATFENWQSEFLQLAVQALLVASYIGQNRTFNADFSADKDDVKELNRKLDALLAERDATGGLIDRSGR